MLMRSRLIELLSRFYARYPEFADKTFLSVKGGAQVQGSGPDGSPENLPRSVDNTNAKLGGIKKMDLFEMARVPDNVPLEDMIRTLAQLKSEGKFDHIGISECSAESLRRAHAVHPITAVEIEVSLWSYEEETKKVITTAKELGVTVEAYSPLGRGFLTGTIKSMKEIPSGDMRHRFSRFRGDAFEHNMAFVNAVKAIADKKGVTPAQLALAWVVSLGPPTLFPFPGLRTTTAIWKGGRTGRD